MDTVEVRQLYKNLPGRFELGPLDLRVAPGEILGVMGPDGAGKTTLLRLLWGFMRPEGGRISVFGLTPHLEQVKVRLRAGYLPANPAAYPGLTAGQFLEFIGKFYEGWNTRRIDALLLRFGIDPNMMVEKLSKGNRTKLSLIAAIGHRPALLLLDEPAARLDPLIRIEILSMVKGLAKDENVSVIATSHISDDLDNIADSIFMLNAGQVIEYARAAFLLEKYSVPRLEAIFDRALDHRHRSQGLV